MMLFRNLAASALMTSVTTCIGLPALAAGSTPTPVTGTATATGTSFFNTGAQGCDGSDVPDAPARAYRDGSGTIHFFAASSVNRAMTGKSFSTLKRDCTVVFQGQGSTNPADFDDADWLTSFYTLDGQHVLAVIHDEFHGYLDASLCPSQDPSRCSVTSLLGAVSNDGGEHFVSVPGSTALGATPPYRYDPNQASTFSYGNPTNIMKMGDYFYIMFNSLNPFLSGHNGVCVARTRNLLDPTSWRLWDGTGFNIHSVDPYATTVSDPGSLSCKPVLPATVGSYAGSLSYMPSRHVYVLAMYQFSGSSDNNVAGTYITTSSDLVHWSSLQLLLADAAVPASQGSEQSYPSLIDPTSPDRNFGTIGDHPVLFTTTAGTDDAQWTLWARQVSLH